MKQVMCTSVRCGVYFTLFARVIVLNVVRLLDNNKQTQDRIFKISALQIIQSCLISFQLERCTQTKKIYRIYMLFTFRFHFIKTSVPQYWF